MPTTTERLKRRQRTRRGGFPRQSKTAQLASHFSMGMGRPTGNVFPTRLKRTLLYSDAYTIASTTGSIGLQQWRVNSAFDFDLSGTGHQPRGFDQLCSASGPYTKYRITAVRVALEFIGDNSGLMVVAAGFSDTATIPSVAGGGTGMIACNAELPGWRSVIAPTYGGLNTVMRFSANIADIENKPRASVIAEDNFAALYNANPADLAYFTVQAQVWGSGTQNLDLIAHFEVDTEFEDPLLLAAS